MKINAAYKVRRLKNDSGLSKLFLAMAFLAVTSPGIRPNLYAQPAAPPAAAPPTEKPAGAQLYYRDVDPKQLFPILQETYHVQFEGVDTVKGPITLISKGDQKVDLAGMLQLLDEVLSNQAKITRREGQIIRIVPRQDIIDKPIELKYAEPQKVVKVLTDLFLVKEDDASEVKAKKAIYIEVHPLLRGILVRGRKEAISAIEDYIKTTQLDAPPAETPPPPISPPPPTEPQPPLLRDFFTLNYMDAEEFQKLLEQDETLTDYTTAIAPNNNLIVFSRNKEIFDKIRQIQKAFDIDRMEIRYLPLKNANAESVAGLLKEIYPPEAVAEAALPEELQRMRSERGRQPAVEEDAYSLDPMVRQALTRAGVIEPATNELLSQALTVVPNSELTIVPDKERNALLIRTFSRNFPRITELVEKLDQPRRQVIIDVFITEVTLDKTVDLGIDFTYLHNEKTNTLKQSFPGTRSVSSGLSYEIISNNITAYLRALETTDNLDVISRPQILTKDNSLATLALGRDVPQVVSTNVSVGGAINSAVVYKPVQTELIVTPQIHPDNYVTLNIEQKIDDVSAETFQISENFNPQVIIRRSAKTQLCVKDGQTVCLGGFVGNSIKKNDTSIPLLCDIPVVGRLFQFSSHQKVRTELIIFITPHILDTPQEMLRMTNEMRRLSNSQRLEDRDSDTLVPQRNLRYPPYRDLLPELPPRQDARPREDVPEPNRQDLPEESLAPVENNPQPEPQKQSEQNQPPP